MLKFPANFPPSHNFPRALTNSKTLGSSFLHIWMQLFPYMELIAVLEVRAILSVRSGAPRAREARAERSTMGKKIW